MMYVRVGWQQKVMRQNEVICKQALMIETDRAG
jgi:hypothetical protein